MKTLTLDDLLALHALAIERFGGVSGIRDLGRIDAAVASQIQQVFGAELYPTLHEKAAALLRGIIADYAFADGNKRTGMLAALTLLEYNGLTFSARKGELEDFAVSVAVNHLSIEQIAEWLRTHTV